MRFSRKMQKDLTATQWALLGSTLLLFTLLSLNAVSNFAISSNIPIVVNDKTASLSVSVSGMSTKKDDTTDTDPAVRYELVDEVEGKHVRYAAFEDASHPWSTTHKRSRSTPVSVGRWAELLSSSSPNSLRFARDLTEIMKVRRSDERASAQ